MIKSSINVRYSAEAKVGTFLEEQYAFTLIQKNLNTSFRLIRVLNKKILNNMKCFECDGEYEKVRIDYECSTPYGELIVPDVDVFTCNHCGDECLDHKNSKKIDDAAQRLKIV